MAWHRMEKVGMPTMVAVLRMGTGKGMGMFQDVVWVKAVQGMGMICNGAKVRAGKGTCMF